MAQEAKRQTAIKINIGDIKSGRFVKAEGEWEPNYILTKYNTRVSRANILGITVSGLDDQAGGSFVVDDGSEKITIRSFEKITVPVKTGDIVLVIGRPREFANEIYIMPEIIKKIESPGWLEHRKIELESLYKDLETIDLPAASPKISKELQTPKYSAETVVEEETIAQETSKQTPPVNSPSVKIVDEEQDNEPPKAKDTKNPFDAIMEIIKNLDKGEGADVDVVIKESGLASEKAENIINNLLMDGEAFEMRPGKIKLLD